MRIEVRQGSLTDGDETVLVNASNTNGQLGSGVSAAIRRACGRGFQDHIFAELERVFGGPMGPGEVLITHAGAHPRAKYVAHVAVMDYRNGFTGQSYPTVALIEAACAKLWPLLDALPGGPHSVAMVALGAGTGNLGVVDPTRVALQTLETAKPKNLERVCFYGYELHEFVAMQDVLGVQGA